MKHLNRREFLKSSGLWIATSLALPGMAYRRAAPYGVLPLPAAPTTVSAYQLQTPHQVLQMDVSASTWSARFSQLASQGYRPIWVQGSTNGAGAATYSAIWVRDGAGPWVEWQDLTASEYQTKFNTYSAQGYLPISVSGYQNGGVNQFAAVWLSAPGIGYSAIHDASASDYQTFVTNAITAKLMPLVVDGYDNGGSANYISVWANLPAHPFQARHGLSATDYQTFFSQYAPEGYHVTSVSGYAVGASTYFAAYMVEDSVTDSPAYDNWLPGDLYTQAVSREQTDYQPTVIRGYEVGASRKFAGVWIKKARTWTTTGAANPELVSFDATMQSFMQARNIPCGALAVTKDSRLVYARGYCWDGYHVDPVNPDCLFRIASLTKQLTSMAVMRLVQENSLHLSDHLTTLLSLTPLDTRMNDITVLELLQHTGGWNRDTSGFDPMFADQTIAAAQGVPLPISQSDIIDYMTTKRNLDFTPGTLYDYSNYGYLLLGRIIEAVTHVPYATYMQNAVFSPLGISRIVLGASEFEGRHAGEVPYFVTDPSLYANMRHAGAPVNVMAPYGNFNIENMDSHGGFLASAVDLARFATAFDATGLHPLLTQTTIDQIFKVPSLGVFPDGSWYGCGWMVRPAGSGLNTWHNGSLPGTSTLTVRNYNGLDWVVLFDQRDDPSGLSYDEIDPDLQSAASAVTHWPGGDLFPNYGLPSILHYIYLPLARQ